MDEQQKDINAEQSSKTKQRKAYRSKSELSAEERTQLDRKEEIVQPLARKRLHKKRISNEEWEKVQEAFGCSLRHAHTHVKKYAQQMNHHPNQPELWGNSLIPNRGRPEGTFNIQTEKYRLSVRVGLTERTRIGVHHDGSKSKVDLEPGIDVLADVQEFAKSVIPDTPSEYTTRRVVRNLVENDPAYYKLATEGELALIRDAAPKLPFEVNEIDDIWAWDFCDLPNYVNNKGVISTVAMLVLIDYKSDKYLYVRVIPKKEIDPQGNILGTSFSKMDAASSAATAMYLLKRRPLFFYNDRDKRFNLADELERVTAPGQTPVGVHKALLEQPWSRGLQEGGFQRRLHRWATRYKGKYTKAKRRTIRKAIERPDLLPTPQLIAGDIKEFFENVNNEPRVRFRHRKGQAPSSTRNEVYNSFTAPRGCPSIQQLFHLPIVKHEDWVILDDEGFNFAQAGEDHFIPTVSSVEQLTDLTLRWMNAALSKGKNHLFAIKLDFGWVGEICLDGVWYEVIPRSTNPFNYEQRMIARNTAIRRLKDRLKVDYTADTQMFLEHFGTMPERLNTTVDGQYQLPEGSQQTRAEVGAESNEQPVRPATAQASSTSQREQAKPRLDWSDLL